MSSSALPEPMPVLFDGETGDPDDILTILFLAAHPRTTLVGVSLFPGSFDQVALVRAVLHRVGLANVPVGGNRAREDGKKRTGGNPRGFGVPQVDGVREEPDFEAVELFAHLIEQHPNLTICTGGPLGNVHSFLTDQRFEHLSIERMVVQGGYAGARCVRRENQLEKFLDKDYVQTWNFGANVQGAELFLRTDRIRSKTLCSKDVCHRVTFTKEIQKKLEQWVDGDRENLPLAALVAWVRQDRLKKSRTGGGKKLHDPLAASLIICPEICELMEVKVGRDARKKAWGSVPCEGTGVFISVAVDMELFANVFGSGASSR